MAGVAAGKMDRSVVLQTAVQTQAASGAVLTSWTTNPVTVSAEWMPNGGKEAYQAMGRLEATVDGVFKIHYRTPVPAAGGSRVLWNGRTYDVQVVTEGGRQESLLLTVKARADA